MAKKTLTQQVEDLTAIVTKLVLAQSGNAVVDNDGDVEDDNKGDDSLFVIVPMAFKYAGVGEKVRAKRSGRVFVKQSLAVKGKAQKVSVTFKANDPTMESGTYTGTFKWVETEHGARPAVVFNS